MDVNNHVVIGAPFHTVYRGKITPLTCGVVTGLNITHSLEGVVFKGTERISYTKRAGVLIRFVEEDNLPLYEEQKDSSEEERKKLIEDGMWVERFTYIPDLPFSGEALRDIWTIPSGVSIEEWQAIREEKIRKYLTSSYPVELREEEDKELFLATLDYMKEKGLSGKPARVARERLDVGGYIWLFPNEYRVKNYLLISGYSPPPRVRISHSRVKISRVEKTV